MKVKCPSCGAVGKLPADKLPAQGANIRCPSCSYVFFVGGPSASNLVESAGETSRPAAPSEPAAAAPESAQDILRAAREKAARITQSAASIGAIPAAAPSSAADDLASPAAEAQPAIPRFDQARRSARVSQNVAAIPSAESSPGADSNQASPSNARTSVVDPNDSSQAGESASASSLGTQGDAEAEISLSGRYLVDGAAVHRGTPAVGVRPVTAPRKLGSGLHATVPPAAESEPTENPGASGLGAAAAPPATDVVEPPAAHVPAFPRTRRWRLRMESGITFDFGDTESVRDWLSGQKSHEGITLQADGAGEFLPITGWPDLVEVRAAGYRTRYSSTAALGAVRTSGPLSSGPLSSGPLAGSTALGSSSSESAVPHALPSASATAAPAAAAPPAPRKSTSVKSLRSTGPITAQTKPVDPAVKSARRRMIALAAGLVVTVAVAAGLWLGANERPVRLPDTPAGERMEWVMRQINGDSSMLARPEVEQVFAAEFLREIPPDRVIGQLRALDDWQPEFRLLGVESSSGGWDLRARLMTVGGHMGEVRLLVSDQEPHRVLGMSVRRIANR